jgi:hypothetical protein
VTAAIVIFDADGHELQLDETEADQLLGASAGLEAATVSACPGCRSRILAAVAVVDELGVTAPVSRAAEIIELADDAPTLHLYVRDLSTRCHHRPWLDPGRAEWSDTISSLAGRPSPTH